jgi:L-2-amino-thiazoline-4-carboxylic acid hydrolase
LIFLKYLICCLYELRTAPSLNLRKNGCGGSRRFFSIFSCVAGYFVCVKGHNIMNITHLKLREIQAPIVTRLINGFAGEIGHEKAIKIAGNVIKEDAMASGKEMALQYAGNTLAELSKVVKEVWAKDGALRIKMIKETDSELFFDVTYCGYARLYEKMRIKEMGSVLSCTRDFSFISGFNPRIELKRTQTIMEGAKYCDFRFKRVTFSA